MKYAFVNTTISPTTGETIQAPSATKALRLDLAGTMIMLANEWDTEPIQLDEAKATLLACIEQAESEGAKKQEMLRMRANISMIDSMAEVIKYCYNYMLRSSGLAVYRKV